MSRNRSSNQKFLSRLTDGRRKPAKRSESALEGLKGLAKQVGDRLEGGPTKRSIASKKAAGTRRRKAAERSASAKKGARTRARSR